MANVKVYGQQTDKAKTICRHSINIGAINQHN